MKCYRVWFEDGGAVLVDAESREEARKEGILLSMRQGFNTIVVNIIECSTKEPPTNPSGEC